MSKGLFIFLLGLILIGLIYLLTGCVTVDKNTKEYIQGFSDGRTVGFIEGREDMIKNYDRYIERILDLELKEKNK